MIFRKEVLKMFNLLRGAKPDLFMAEIIYKRLSLMDEDSRLQLLSLLICGTVSKSPIWNEVSKELE